MISSTEGAVDPLPHSQYELKKFMDEDCKTPEDYRKKVISNSNQDKQRKGSSQNNSGTIISGTVLSLLGMLCTAIGCACKYSKWDKTPTEPEQTSSPNSGANDQVEISSEQPKHQHPIPSLEPGQAQTDIAMEDRMGRPTPYSVTQTWITRSSQPTP